MVIREDEDSADKMTTCWHIDEVEGQKRVDGSFVSAAGVDWPSWLPCMAGTDAKRCHKTVGHVDGCRIA